MTSAQLVPAIVIPLVVWRIYSRVRRNIGRQRFRPRRLVARIVVFTLLCGLIASFAWRSPALAEAFAGGLCIGSVLAWAGIHLTRFDFSGPEKCYTPNTVIGVAVTLLLVGRIVYRVLVLRGGSLPPQEPVPSMFHSPMTLVFFGITAGYYIVYGIGVLVRGKRLAATSVVPPTSDE